MRPSNRSFQRASQAPQDASLRPLCRQILGAGGHMPSGTKGLSGSQEAWATQDLPLPGPDKIVVQDWEHPVRAPSKETKGFEPPPNPNWHSSGLDKSSLQTQIPLFKLGSVQSRRRLKKTKGLEPPPNPNWHLSGLDKSSLQTQTTCSRLEATSQGTV